MQNNQPKWHSSQRNLFQHLHGSFTSDCDNDIAQSLGIETRFAVREVVLSMTLAVEHDRYHLRFQLTSHLRLKTFDIRLCHTMVLSQQRWRYSRVESPAEFLTSEP